MSLNRTTSRRRTTSWRTTSRRITSRRRTPFSQTTGTTVVTNLESFFLRLAEKSSHVHITERVLYTEVQRKGSVAYHRDPVVVGFDLPQRQTVRMASHTFSPYKIMSPMSKIRIFHTPERARTALLYEGTLIGRRCSVCTPSWSRATACARTEGLCLFLFLFLQLCRHWNLDVYIKGSAHLQIFSFSFDLFMWMTWLL